MANIIHAEATAKDIELLYEAGRIARRAREKGNHPFGALLADAQGNILLTGENTVVTEHNDCGHAETNLMIAASKKYDHDFLAACSIYTTGEPCFMCAGAIYWANVRRIVFGFSEQDLLKMTGSDPKNPTCSLPCKEILRYGQKDFEIVGPVQDRRLIETLLDDHKGFWTGE